MMLLNDDKDKCLDMLIDILIDQSETHNNCVADHLSEYRKAGNFNTHRLCDHFGDDCNGCVKYCINHIYNDDNEFEEEEG